VSDVVQYSHWALSQKEHNNIVGVVARGFSMEPEIREGDIVFVDQEKQPSQGNIVLCYQEEKVQLVRFGSQPGSNGHGNDDAHVYGVVIGINRKLGQ